MKMSIGKSLPSRLGASMKVGTKIFALVGLCLGLLTLTAGTGIWQMNKIGVEIVGIAERDLPLTKSLTKVTVYQLEQAVEFERGIRLGETMSERPEIVADYDKSVKKFEALTVKIEKEFKLAETISGEAKEAVASLEEREIFESTLTSLKYLDKLHMDYDMLSRQVFSLIKAGDINEARAIIPKIEMEQEELVVGLEKLLFEVEEFTLKAAVTAEAHEKFALILMIAISVFAFVVGLISAIVLIKRSITRPLNEVVTGITALTSGDLSLEVKVYNDDEIGAVAKAYAVFRENLVRTRQLEKEQEEKRLAEEERKAVVTSATSEFVSNIGEIVETVSSASTELQNTAQSMSSIAEETSSQASAVAAASEEASSNVQTVASATEQMSASISEINSQVADASRAAKTAVENVAVTAGQMNALAQTADKIGNVVSIISDIAEQTNLLALNATIESARAGEAGKGFAVVASEVKALANETAKATESISKHISEIQTATGEAVDSIDEVGKTIKLIEETSTAIAAAMEEQGIATQEVSRNVQEAASGTQDVSSNIAGVTQASQEAGAASGQVTTAAGELSQQSERLKFEVDKYLDQVKVA